MVLTEKKIETIVDDNLKLINEKKRLDRFLFHSTLHGITDGLKKSHKLKNLELFEINIANHLSEHVKTCNKNEPCMREQCMSLQLSLIDTKKREIVNAKTLWENTKSNPIGIGILLIGIANVVIALLKIFGLD